MHETQCIQTSLAADISLTVIAAAEFNLTQAVFIHDIHKAVLFRILILMTAMTVKLISAASDVCMH